MHLFLVGAGHVGLVTAVGFARLGHRLTVADIDTQRIADLQDGRPPIFEPGLEEGIRTLASAGRLSFTADLQPPPDAAMSIITVSTPSGPDGPLSTAHVEAAVRSLLDLVGPDHTIVVRSTLPLDGPTRLLAQTAGRVDRPAIVTNPEFMREGVALGDFESPDRIVVGWMEPRDQAAASAVLALYEGIEAPTLVADASSVALIKLATNVFLAAKVGYANELARVSDAIGADVATVTAGIGLDARIGPAFLKVGPGFGGSCLPEQAIALPLITARLGVRTPIIDAISASNESHQRAIVARLGTLLDSDQALGATSGRPLRGRRVALLGLAFKADTDDVRESPALSLASHLRVAGARVVGTDPRAVVKARQADPELEITDSISDAIAGADAVLVATEWREYAALDWSELATQMAGDLVYDTRDVLDGEAVRRAGLRYVSLGRREGTEPVVTAPVGARATAAR